MNEPKPLPSETKLVERLKDRAEDFYDSETRPDDTHKLLVEAAAALASLADELRQAQERIEILTGTLERARSHIENRGAFRSHTLMLEMIDTALNDAAASGPKEG